MTRRWLPVADHGAMAVSLVYPRHTSSLSTTTATLRAPAALPACSPSPRRGQIARAPHRLRGSQSPLPREEGGLEDPGARRRLAGAPAPRAGAALVNPGDLIEALDQWNVRSSLHGS